MDPKHLKVLLNTVIVRPPKQEIYAFGTTTVTYNLVTQPLYQAINIDHRKE